MTTATELARQAFQYYRHARFWKPFAAEGQRLHVFTCGRDTREEPGHRGHGGRTNIDIWDYRTAVDLTHHFARHHREIGVQIEQPVSKAIIDATTRTYDTTRFSRRLVDQNCVIIGSPDVSDFAEILLAELVRVEPYHPQIGLSSTRIKFLKSGRSHSSFYSDPGEGDDAVEGIKVVDHDGGEHTYANTPTRTHGVIVLADNPFPLPESDFGQARRATWTTIGLAGRSEAAEPSRSSSSPVTPGSRPAPCRSCSPMTQMSISMSSTASTRRSP